MKMVYPQVKQSGEMRRFRRFFWIEATALVVSGAACAVECPSREAMSHDLVQGINALRSKPQQCGDGFFQAAPPLVWSEILAEAARRHAKDMAIRGYFSHDAPAGDNMEERLVKSGYAWSSLGENIAMGQESVSQALSSWLASPGHCEAMMQPEFAHAGMGCAKSGAELYWVLDLAEPRR